MTQDEARETRVSRVRVAVLAACVGLVAVGAGILFTFDPSHAGFFPPCPLKALTGLYCPGCGSTRALHHLTHGRLVTALGYNPLVPILLPYVALAGGRQALQWSGLLRPRHGRRAPAAWIWALFGVILAFGILRNIPAGPFVHLAPGP